MCIRQNLIPLYSLVVSVIYSVHDILRILDGDIGIGVWTEHMQNDISNKCLDLPDHAFLLQR